jgi:hypothetical protein
MSLHKFSLANPCFYGFFHSMNQRAEIWDTQGTSVLNSEQSKGRLKRLSFEILVFEASYGIACPQHGKTRKVVLNQSFLLEKTSVSQGQPYTQRIVEPFTSKIQECRTNLCSATENVGSFDEAAWILNGEGGHAAARFAGYESPFSGDTHHFPKGVA